METSNTVVTGVLFFVMFAIVSYNVFFVVREAIKCLLGIANRKRLKWITTMIKADKERVVHALDRLGAKTLEGEWVHSGQILVHFEPFVIWPFLSNEYRVSLDKGLKDTEDYDVAYTFSHLVPIEWYRSSIKEVWLAYKFLRKFEPALRKELDNKSEGQ